MPRDGSGNYTLPVGNPVVSNTVIASSWANVTMSDIATQLNNVLTRDGILGPTNEFKLIDGNVSVPGLGFNSEPGLGLYRVNTSILGFSAAGKQTIINDASTAGNVITSLYPRSAGQAELRLNQDIYGTADTTQFRLYQSSVGGIIQSLAVGAGSVKPIFYTATKHDFTGPIWAGDDTGIINIDRINNVANFGRLRFTTAESTRFELQYSATGGETSNAGNLSIYRVQNDGSTSENAFNIDRASGVVSMQRQLQVGTADIAGTTSLICTHQSQFGGQLGVTVSGVAVTATSGSISAFGGFGWTASNTSFGLVSTSFGLVGGGPTRIIRWTDGNSIGAVQDIESIHNPGVSAQWRFEATTGVYFEMRDSGVGASTGGWIATSDRRVKTEITPISGALDKLLSIGGYTYFKQDMKGECGIAPRKAGYIAQEIQAVLPEAVTVADDEIGTLSVDHNGVIGLLIEAVKELNARTLIH